MTAEELINTLTAMISEENGVDPTTAVVIVKEYTGCEKVTHIHYDGENIRLTDEDNV